MHAPQERNATLDGLTVERFVAGFAGLVTHGLAWIRVEHRLGILFAPEDVVADLDSVCRRQGQSVVLLV